MSVEVLDESGADLDVDVSALAGLGRFVLDRMRMHPATEMCLRLVDEATIETLNVQWMQAEGPTDVLAFPMDELTPGRIGEEAPEGYLGDLALCPQVAARQAPEHHHPAGDEIDLLCVHGILHLLGYDHAEPDEHQEMFALQTRLLAEWQGVREGQRLDDEPREGRADVTVTDAWLVGIAVLLVVVAGITASAEAALASFSKARAQELLTEGRRGATRLLAITDDAPRYLNTVLLLRKAAETTAVVLVTLVVADTFSSWWERILLAAGVMVIVSYVFVGVAPRTLGRQHAERVALMLAGPVTALTRVAGPLPRLLILLGNALTPGKGFRQGPFQSEAELRELVDLAEQSALIESGERAMIHSVFELGDTIVREVMVPRTEMVVIERYKTLRQATSLALRSGFSRIPVIGDSVDDVVGVAYLKDVTRRVFDNHEAESTERIETVMRTCVFVPDSKPVDELLREMQQQRMHVAIVVDEYGGTAGMVTIEDVLEEIVGEITDEYDVEPDEVEQLANGAVRVSARFPVDDLDDVVGVGIDDEDVDSVGGLLAKYLGKVPIAGSEVEVEGLRFTAEAPTGRRNRIGRVVISPVGDGEPVPSPDTTEQPTSTG